MKSKRIHFFVGVFLSGAISANNGYALEVSAEKENKVDQVSERQYGLSLHAGLSQQHYNSETSTLKNIIFQPYYSWSNTWVSASLPWYSVDGDYIIQTSRPVVQQVCKPILALSNVQQQLRIRAGRLTQARINACTLAAQSDTRVSSQGEGVGDATVTVNYLYPMGSGGTWSLLSAVSYKFDNGDMEKGLGSGTNDLGVDFTLSRDAEKWHNNFTLGHIAVLESENTFYQSYNYGAVDTSYDATSWLSVGATYSHEQASIVGGEAINSIACYGSFKVSENLTVSLSVTQYKDAADYPDREASLSITYSL
jgi:hypothetical protein